MRRVLLGLAPTGRGDFWGADSFRRLVRLSGVPAERWHECEHLNVFASPGDSVRLSESRRAFVLRKVGGRETYTLALGLAIPALVWPGVGVSRWWEGERVEIPDARLYVVPHTSGRNRLYNDRREVARLRRIVNLFWAVSERRSVGNG